MNEESSNQDQMPQFTTMTKTKVKEKIRLPNYKNISITQLVLVSIVFLILQYVTYFCLETFKSYSNINIVYYDTTRDFMVFLTMLVILCVEKFLKTNPYVFIRIATILTNILLLLCLIQTNIYYEYNKELKNSLLVFQYVLEFFLTVLGGIALGLQILGCFYYMIKSIKKTDQEQQNSQCLLLAIFLSLQTFAQNIHDIVSQTSNITPTQIILYTGIVICLLLYFLLPFIPIHTYDSNELSISELLDGIYNAYDLESESKIQKIQIEKGNYDEENQYLIDDKHSIKLRKLKRLPKIIQFYYNVLLKQTIGIKMLLESLLYSFIQCTSQMYSQLNYSQSLYPNCLSQSPYTSFYSTCWMDNYLFNYYFTLQTCVIIVTLLINGFIYDFISINTQNDQFCQYFQITLSSLISFISIIIPSVFSIQYEGFRESYIYLMFISQALTLMTITSNIIQVFKSSFKITICMTWSYIYIFMVIFDFINIYYPFIGSGVEELLILIFILILIIISTYIK